MFKVNNKDTRTTPVASKYLEIKKGCENVENKTLLQHHWRCYNVIMLL